MRGYENKQPNRRKRRPQKRLMDVMGQTQVWQRSMLGIGWHEGKWSTVAILKKSSQKTSRKINTRKTHSLPNTLGGESCLRKFWASDTWFPVFWEVFFYFQFSAGDTTQAPLNSLTSEWDLNFDKTEHWAVTTSTGAEKGPGCSFVSYQLVPQDGVLTQPRQVTESIPMLFSRHSRVSLFQL